MLRTALIAAALAALVTPATAQQAGTWTDPSGHYTLTPDAADGRLLSPSGGENAADFQLGPDATPVRLCSVRVAQNIPNSNAMSQEALNRRMAMLFGPDAQIAPGSLTITDRRVIERDGVAVFASRVENPEAILHYRHFALASPQGATFQVMSCGGPPPVTAAEEATFDAFLDTLHFTQ